MENPTSKRRHASNANRATHKVQKVSHSGNTDRKSNVEIGEASLTGGDSSTEGGKSVNWLSLPAEIWSSIFQWIPTKEKVTSRLVSKNWKNNVDLLSAFKVRVDGRMAEEKLSQIFSKRIQTLELLSLQKDFNLGIQFPNYVKELIVTTLVSPPIFIQCCKLFSDVQVLRFISTIKSDTTFSWDSMEASTKALCSLKKLQEIDVMIHSFAKRDLQSSLTFNVIFNNPRVIFASLTTININMCLHHEEIEMFLTFLILCRDTIKNITTRIGCVSPGNQTVGRDFCFSKASWFKDLKSLKLNSFHVFRSQVCGNCDIDYVFSEILRHQTTLIRVTLDYGDTNVGDVYEILQSNVNLRSCKVFRVSCNFMMEVESLLVVPKESQQLEELALDFVNSAVIYCYPSSAPRLEMRFFDLRDLPPALRKLSIRGCSLPKQQFLTALEGLKHVEELNVGDCIFRDPSSRVPLFVEICHLLGSDNCGVLRFVFDAFDAVDVEIDAQKWNRIKEAAENYGILQHQDENNGFSFEIPSYDFRFTKEQIREFVSIVDGISANDVSMVSTFNSSTASGAN